MLGRDKKRLAIFLVIALVLIVGGWLVYDQLTFIETDDAMVEAHTLMPAAKVGGIVQDVQVNENQKVKNGDVLVRIDSRDTTNTLHQVQGELGSVQARLADAKVNFKRIAALFKSGAVAKQRFDSAKATLEGLTKKAEAMAAQADQAKLNLSYTEVVAPADGVVAKRSAEPGMIVPMGQPLLGFVEGQSRWVDANFKETQIRHIRVGNPAKVTVDAIPGRVFTGEVESLSPATGATFTLLPPDNSTGNFTKVVQRVPVRIRLDQLTPDDVDLLRAGLSANVSIRIR